MALAAFKVFVDRFVVCYIADFLPGIPQGILAFQLEAFESHCMQGDFYDFYTPEETAGAVVLHHALLTDNASMRARLLRMHKQPYYTQMPLFDFDGVLRALLELVCKQGSLQHLQMLLRLPGIVTILPESTLSTVLDVLMRWSANNADLSDTDSDAEYSDTDPDIECLDDGAIAECSDDDTTSEVTNEADAASADFVNNQKQKARWLMKLHPEACSEVTELARSLLLAREHSDFVLELLVAKLVEIPNLAECEPRFVDAALMELLLPEYLTPKCLERCARLNNLDAVKLIHDHASTFPEELFTARVMDAAASGGSLSVVQFLHENRTEGCTSEAMVLAAQGLHLHVVQCARDNEERVHTRGDRSCGHEWG